MGKNAREACSILGAPRVKAAMHLTERATYRYKHRMTNGARAIPYTELVTLILAQQSVTALDGLAGGAPPRRSLARVSAELRRLGRDDLAEQVTERVGAGRKRGQRPPAPGETRPYKVQRSNDSDVARVPTAHIGAKRGDSVRVTFVPGDDERTITGPAIVIEGDAP